MEPAALDSQTAESDERVGKNGNQLWSVIFAFRAFMAASVRLFT